jgi:hypothetical protein
LVRDEAGDPPFNPWSYDRARRAICGQNRLRPDAGARQPSGTGSAVINMIRQADLAFVPAMTLLREGQ